MTLERVAVIAVHGVADQQPGDTARAVAELLVASAPDGVKYSGVSTESFSLPVHPLEPSLRVARTSEATPFGQHRSLLKSLVQSGRSDFQRENWQASEKLSQWLQDRKTAIAKIQPGAASRSRDGGDTPSGRDRGIEATNYLLEKSAANGARVEAYNTTRIGLTRSSAGEHTGVDVYEMYWADLSRLSGAIPRIVTELFTLIFRLSKLGRETVDEARCRMHRERGGASKSWDWVANTQIALDWLFCNGLAQFFSALLVLALVTTMLGVGSAASEPDDLLRLLGGATATIALLVLAYRRNDKPALWIVPLCVAALGTAILPQFTTISAPAAVVLLLVLVTLVYEVGLRVADDRFPMTLVIGRTMWVAMLLLMFASAWDLSLHDYRQVLERWMRASLMATEVALLAVKWWWVVVAPLLIAWWIAGMLASRGADYEGKASIATGRLGFCVSLGTFVMMTMAIWALLSTVLDLAAKGVAYEPCIFVDGPAKQPQYAGFTSCPWVKLPLVVPEAASPANAKPDSLAAGAAAAAGPPPSSAQEFMARRYVATTAFFSLLAALLLSLILYLAVMLVPSILAELKLLRERARRDAHGGQARSRRTHASPVDTQAKAARDAATRRLGRWLTLGYRQLDRAVLTVTLLACLASAIVAMVLLGDHFGTSGLQGLLEHGEAGASMVSQALLQPLILSAAAIATALTLLGGLLSKYLPSLRAPLDIALDVDNHFREFPRRSIPRARIFSRYKALLDHVAAQGYERVVIVAHSQGTVISAELLRFLASADTRRGGSQGQSPSWPQGTPGTGLSLLTLGCPLRQLYAARFPSLYHWVLRRQPGGNGPSAADIGVERWANAFASGDYVGRWLWSSPDFPGDVLGHPMLDTVHPKAFGRHDAYSPFDPVPPDAGGLATVRELEVCLGLGAHTHYFEPEQAGVAWLIDFLVGAPTLTPPARPEPVS